MKIFHFVNLLMTITNAMAVNRTLCCKESEILVYENKFECYDRTTDTKRKFDLLDCSYFHSRNGELFNFTVNSEDQLEIFINGSEFNPELQDVGSYCVHDGVIIEANGTYNYPSPVPVAVLCFDEETSDRTVLGYCMLVSCVFLTITAIIYASMPELRDLQGKSIASLCGSLAIANLVYGAMTFIYIPVENSWCAFGGFLQYFWLMAGFFWMNAIAIQILRSVRRSMLPDHGWREYTWYAVYAWGCPALLTLCVVIANYVPGKHLVPGIGLIHCWFRLKQSQWAYMYSVIAILLFINISIFVYCSTILWRHRFFSSNIQALRYKFCMSFRLLVVMGLTWIFDLASVAHGKYHVIWMIMDLINTLQGVLFFVILVLLRLKTIKALNRRGLLCCMSGIVERYLAKTDDVEGHIVEHTMAVPLDDQMDDKIFRSRD